MGTVPVAREEPYSWWQLGIYTLLNLIGVGKYKMCQHQRLLSDPCSTCGR